MSQVDVIQPVGCPNCGGEFSRRPVRPADRLMKYPASPTRVLRDDDCVEMRKRA